MEHNAVAIILARAGSKGIPGKNLRTVGGFSLVARTILAARSAISVSAVYVSTDGEDIAKEAFRYGAKVIERPEDLADDIASSESGWLHALPVVRLEHPELESLVLLQCTSPFTNGTDIDGCLAEMNAQGAACALSVFDDHSFLWKRDSDGFGRGVNHDETQQRKRRQDLAPSYRESGAIYCVKVSEFERTGQRFCGPAALYVVDHPPLEIDTIDDLILSDALASLRQPATPPVERLRRVQAVIMDFDGVMTDDRATVDENGVESVVVSRADGLGIERLRTQGLTKLLIVSKERNPVVSKRAEKIKVDCLQATDDKVKAIDAWLSDQGISWNDVMYLGNDINDLGAIRQAGLSACPRDANREVRIEANWILPIDGGRGFVRAVTDEVFNAKSKSQTDHPI